MNINDFNIGIELEYINGATRDVANEIENAGVDCELVPYGRCHSTHRGWIVTTDQTVSRNISYGTGDASGGEVVSPKLKYRDALAQVKTVCDAMNRVGDVDVNRHCGLHISISWPNMNTSQVRKVLGRYKEYEGVIDAFMPPSRRGNRNRWCGSLDASWVSRVVNGSGDRLTQLREGGKFIKLNLMNLGDGARSRIEFRHHSGTTDAAKVQRWIEFLCHFILKAQSDVALTRNYRRTRNILFAEVREQMERIGIVMKNGKDEGQRVFRLYRPEEHDQEPFGYVGIVTHAQLDDMYVGGASAMGRGELNENFMAFAQRYTTDEIDTGVYDGMPQHIARFYEARTRHFANQ